MIAFTCKYLKFFRIFSKNEAQSQNCGQNEQKFTYALKMRDPFLALRPLTADVDEPVEYTNFIILVNFFSKIEEKLSRVT